MSNHIYRTEGVVLSSLPDGEANRYLRIFTKELGLIGGTARSVREGRSKLRYGLADYSVSLVSLVRGREVWRVVNAVPLWNAYSEFKADAPRLRAALRLLSLVGKLLAGEGKHEELYSTLTESLEFLRLEPLPRGELASFQLIAALRILFLLGYAEDRQNFAPFVPPLAGTGYTHELLSSFAPLHAEARASIERALAATQLAHRL